MKVYYDKLSKEEKEKVKLEFSKENDYKVYKKTEKIIVFCILGIIVSIASGIFDYIYRTGILNYIIDGFLFLFSVIVFFRMQNIKKNMLNKFALSKKKDK